MKLRLELDGEVDGRWLAEVTDLPGVLAYGTSREDALARVEVLSLRVMAGRMERGKGIPRLPEAFTVAA
jgi:predicted RNase H-like HicB family nuclease